MKKILGLFFVFLFLLSGCTLPSFLSKEKTLMPDQAKEAALKFINEKLVSKGNEVKINEVAEEKGLYKLSVEFVNGEKSDAYLTKDGKLFFPQAINVDEYGKEAAQASDTKAEATNAPLVKSDKPEVELFVMSHCPYGTQIEKGILPVLDVLKDKINFSLKFVDYSMHGEKEINEELNQYCVQKEFPDKLKSYLSCFLEAGDTAGCVKKVALDSTKLDSCIKSTDSEFKVTEKFNDKNSWSGTYPPVDIYKTENQKYGVQGSPTLVVNGSQVSSARDSQSLLNSICAAFNNLPSECSQKLSATAPSSGFGGGTSDSATDANCGS